MTRTILVLFLFLFFTLFLLSSPARAAAPSLLLEADRLELAVDGSLLAEGRVVITYGEIVLEAEKALYREGLITAEGKVVVTTGEGTIQATRLVFDPAKKTLAGEGIHGAINGYFVRAEEVRPREEGMAFIGAGLTRCDRERPCYEFLAGRLVISGRRVTVEKGWLVLAGYRVIPFPRLTLDLDRLEAWPRLTAGYDGRGLYLTLSFAFGSRPDFNLVLAPTLSTGEGLALRLAFPWRPGGGITVAPSVYLSGSEPTYGVSVQGKEQRRGDMDFSWRGYWENRSRGAETGLALRWGWADPEKDGAEISLTLGIRHDFSSGNRPFLTVHFGGFRPLNEEWGLGLSWTYEISEGVWKQIEISGRRYFHCYFLRGDWDVLTRSLRLSGGINF